LVASVAEQPLSGKNIEGLPQWTPTDSQLES
jgi:hypothetical protein